MRVAFVGKGGVGKSTMATLFFLNLLKQNKNTVLIDADINVHVPHLLGIKLSADKALSSHKNTDKIRRYLIGSTTKIKSLDHFYKTTPPSRGANLFRLDDNEIIKDFSYSYKSGYVMVVGTYGADEIGKSCYHTNLSVLENLLSFASLDDGDVLVADMVAGIDAFSNTLHKQFDVLFLIVEPTQESIIVYDQYSRLAKHAGMYDRLFVVGNKVEDKEDEKYIEAKIPRDRYLGSLIKNAKLRKLRQQGMPLAIDTLEVFKTDLFDKLFQVLQKYKKDPNTRLQELHKLHLSYIKQDYVSNAVGDISDQIDKDFKF